MRDPCGADVERGGHVAVPWELTQTHVRAYVARESIGLCILGPRV